MAHVIPVYGLRVVREATFRVGSKQINQPSDAAELFASYLVLTLDTKYRVAGLHTAASLTLGRVDVHQRDVFKIAVYLNASAVICGHHHPSGEPTPSEYDSQHTRRLMQAGHLLRQVFGKVKL